MKTLTIILICVICLAGLKIFWQSYDSLRVAAVAPIVQIEDALARSEQ